MKTLFILLITVLLSSLFTMSCGDAEHYPNTNIGNPAGGPAFQPFGNDCHTTEILDCTIILSSHNGINNCAAGHQYCENYHWSNCKQ